MAKTQPRTRGPRASMAELGTTGLKTTGGLIREELLRDLQGIKGMKTLREMADNDPIVGAFMFAVEQIMRQVDWKVVPVDDTSEAQKDAEFIDQCRQDMSHTWGDFVAEVLSMLTFGYAPFEICYKLRKGPQRDRDKNSRFTDGQLGWAKFAIRAQDTIERWNMDPKGNVLTINQRTETGQRATMPWEKMINFRTKSTKNNPEGRSILRNAYRPWYFKKRIEEIEGIGIERDLAGLPVLTAPEGLNLWDASDPKAKVIKDAAEDIVRNVRRDEQEGMLLPGGWEFELATTGGSRAFNTTEVINRYDQRIAMTVLADFILLGHGGKFGSFALAKSKTSAFTLSIVGYLNVIRDTFNTVAIPKLFQLNGWPVEELPKLDYNMIEVPPLNELATFITAMFDVGVDVASDPNLVRHLLNLAGLPADLSDEAGGGGTGSQAGSSGRTGGAGTESRRIARQQQRTATRPAAAKPDAKSD